MYDLCVVGAGCIGSAAARHASGWGKVCLIGPKEPEERLLTNERDVFGSHYDEGRITRSSAEDSVWSTLARESIARYRDLEKFTGIQFFDEVGYLICGTKGGEFLEKRVENVKSCSINITHLSNHQLKQKFPYLNFSETDEALYEENNSGYISPRRMIQAQIKTAESQGCDVIYEIVRNVNRCVHNGKPVMSVTTECGRTIYAHKVLLATGAFTNTKKLLPSGIQLDISLCPITVAMVEISEEDYLKIRNMTPISYSGTGPPDWKSKLNRIEGDLVRCYILPPVKYQDGRYFIKLGDSSEYFPKKLTTIMDLKEWFCGRGDETLVQNMVDLILDIVKGITMLSYHGDCCVKTATPSGRPFIDYLHPQLGVAVGGNGSAAKSGDEIGRIAAMLMMKNIWDSTLPRHLFTAKLANKL